MSAGEGTLTAGKDVDNSLETEWRECRSIRSRVGSKLEVDGLGEK